MIDLPENIRDQFKNPKGCDGISVLEIMNNHHIPLWDWCTTLLPYNISGSILDIGCGGGGFLNRIIKRYPNAMFYGLDISQESLHMTEQTNLETIHKDRLKLYLASVDNMPFSDNKFDLVTAIETYFFWPDLAACLHEIFRVISYNGVIAIGSEMQCGNDDKENIIEALEMYGMNIVEDEEMLGLLNKVGFDAECEKYIEKGWTLFIGTKVL